MENKHWKIMKENTHDNLYALMINLCMLISGLVGLFIAWMIFYMNQKSNRKPGINIKDF